jgi:hypothetical protein
MFCISGAKIVTLFLTVYQNDKPVASCLCDYRFKMLKLLMERFVKSSVIGKCQCSLQTTVVNVDTTKKRTTRIIKRFCD